MTESHNEETQTGVKQVEHDELKPATSKKATNWKVLGLSIGAMALVVGLLAVVKIKKQNRGISSDATEASIQKKGAAEAAKAEKAAQAVKQAEVGGDGLQFDSAGNLIGSKVGDLGIQNTTLSGMEEQAKRERKKQEKGEGGHGVESGTGSMSSSGRIEDGIDYNQAKSVATAGNPYANVYRSNSGTRYAGGGNYGGSSPENIEADTKARKAQQEIMRESRLGYSLRLGIHPGAKQDGSGKGDGSAWQPQPSNGRPQGFDDRQAAHQAALADTERKIQGIGQVTQNMRGMAQQAMGGGGMGLASGIGGGGSQSPMMGASKKPMVSQPGDFADMRIGGGPEIVVNEGKFLDCVTTNTVEASLNSGVVVCMVTRDLLSRDGKWVMIPAGTKVMLDAQRVNNMHQERLLMTGHRCIFPDGRSAYFPEKLLPEGMDLNGVLGVSGNLNRHWLKRFGAAIVFGALEGFAASKGGNVTMTGSGAMLLPADQFAVAAASKHFDEVVKSLIQTYGNMLPTITVPSGTRMKIYFSQDVLMNGYMPSSKLSYVKNQGGF